MFGRPLKQITLVAHSWSRQECLLQYAVEETLRLAHCQTSIELQEICSHEETSGRRSSDATTPAETRPGTPCEPETTPLTGLSLCCMGSPFGASRPEPHVAPLFALCIPHTALANSQRVSQSSHDEMQGI